MLGSKREMLKNQHFRLDTPTLKCSFSSTMQNTVKLSAIVIAVLAMFGASCSQQTKPDSSPKGSIVGGSK